MILVVNYSSNMVNILIRLTGGPCLNIYFMKHFNP